MIRPLTILCVCLPLLAGCAQFPEVDAVISEDAKNAPPPELVPLDQILEPATAVDPAKGDETEAELRARAAALQARADRLRRCCKAC